MKKGKTAVIIGVVIAAIIIGVVITQFSTVGNDSVQNGEKIIDVDNDGVPDDVDPYIAAPRVWQTSGPFQIDRTQYRLGELVLVRIGALEPNEKGQIAFLRPSNSTHYQVYITIPFDGSVKETSNQYFKPALSSNAGICTKDDLLGNWTVVFRGTDYKNLKFEIINETIPGDEEHYEPVC